MNEKESLKICNNFKIKKSVLAGLWRFSSSDFQLELNVENHNKLWLPWFMNRLYPWHGESRHFDGLTRCFHFNCNETLRKIREIRRLFPLKSCKNIAKFTQILTSKLSIFKGEINYNIKMNYLTSFLSGNKSSGVFCTIRENFH